MESILSTMGLWVMDGISVAERTSPVMFIRNHYEDMMNQGRKGGIFGGGEQEYLIPGLSIEKEGGINKIETL